MTTPSSVQASDSQFAGQVGEAERVVAREEDRAAETGEQPALCVVHA